MNQISVALAAEYYTIDFIKKISQSTKVDCDIGSGNLPLAERMGFEPMCAFTQTDFESAPL